MIVSIVLGGILVAFAVAAVLVNEGEHAARRARRRAAREPRFFSGPTAAR